MGENLVALCDVDSTILDKRGAEYPGAKKYTDFRKMIEKEKLDGVIVAVPDHNHAYISVYAMKHGLNVYCQKPLCKSVHEARIMARVAAETKVITQMGTQTSAEPRTLRTAEFIQSGAIGEITEIHMTTDRPIWPQGYDRRGRRRSRARDARLGPLAGHGGGPSVPGQMARGHAVYSPEKKRQFAATPLCIIHSPGAGGLDFGSGALGDIAPHSMNVIFLTLDLGAPSAVEVVETSGMKKEMYPDWSIIRFDWAARGVHPPLSIYWYDGTAPSTGDASPAPGHAGRARSGAIARRPGRHGLDRDQGQLSRGPGTFRRPGHGTASGTTAARVGPRGGTQGLGLAVKAGKPAPCHFGYAGPFTEAYQLGTSRYAWAIGSNGIPWTFAITNCQEANQYLRREYRRGWDLKEIAASAWEVPARRS